MAALMVYKKYIGKWGENQDLEECRTIQDFQELTKKYEALCNDDKS